ncbi:unnamed protein product, partial [Mesorhabditis spiculigera]
MGNVMPWGLKAERKRAIERAQQKREEGFRQWRELIAEASPEKQAEWRRIAALSFEELTSTLQKEEITAVEALSAYIQKAIEVQDALNPITEIIREAFEYAEEMDTKWRGSNEKPPFYGVPYSVKSNFHMVGYDCHIGLGKLLEQPKQRENTMVAHLRHLGAVPFCLTNVPQGLLSFACSNSVYGTTGNPHDPAKSPGGSSGGEGCLVAARGTPFGTGSDVAGSLRIPAAYTGCVALKCGQERMTVLHSHGGVPGRGRLGLGFGYFTNSVKDQITLLEHTLGHDNFIKLSPKTPKVPLDKTIINSTTPLRIGYFEWDGFCPVAPAMRRAVVETVEKLRGHGHEMIRFTVPQPELMARLVFKNLLPDAGHYTRRLYEADVVDPYMTEFVRLLSLPSFVRTLLKYAFMFNSPQASLVCASEVEGLNDLRQAQAETDDYNQLFTEYWQELGIDALVCPAFPSPAVKHHWPSKLGFFATITTLFNMVDYPAGVVPVGRATKADDEEIQDETRFPVGWNTALRYLRDSSKNSAGLPIAVQVVALPYKEEMCLRVMQDIERLVNYS